MLVIKHIERTPENNAFIMQVLRVLIYEIAEVCQFFCLRSCDDNSTTWHLYQVSRPKTYAQLITLFHILPHSNDVGAQQFFESTRPLVSGALDQILNIHLDYALIVYGFRLRGSPGELFC